MHNQGPESKHAWSVTMSPALYKPEPNYEKKGAGKKLENFQVANSHLNLEMNYFI